jgi:pSer/pThr/pTyr-binding forkhead associated (FHA) protein
LVELLGGCYWLVDLGSTNGTERGGARVTRVPIGEGDVFQICGQSLWMGYR